jgi:hypothetical protein
MENRILADAKHSAELFDLSERGFHMLRRRADFPSDAEVRLGPRAVRFRVDVLVRYAAELSAKRIIHAEPAQLKHARQKRRQQLESEAPQ